MILLTKFCDFWHCSLWFNIGVCQGSLIPRRFGSHKILAEILT